MNSLHERSLRRVYDDKTLKLLKKDKKKIDLRWLVE